MARKIRTQIYLDPEQHKQLREQAKALGISKAELIRRLISGNISYPTPEAWEEGLRFLEERAAIPYRRVPQEEDQVDLQAWEESKKVIQERMKLQVPQTGRAWTREELYEERLERYPRR